MEKTEKKENLNNFFIYNFPVWLPIAINFFLFPVYTYFLLPEDYGIRAIVLLAILFLGIITDFGINWVIRSKYFSFSNIIERNSYLTTLLLITFFPKGILYVFFYFFSIDIFPIIFENWNVIYNDLFRVQLLIFLFGFSNEVFFAIYIMERKSKNYSIISLLQYFTNILVSLFGLIYLKKGIISLLYGELAGVFIFQVFSFYIFRNILVLRFHKKAVKDVLKIGIPAMPKSLFQNIQMNIDKYILQIFLPVSELGIFSKSQFLYRGFSGFNKAFSNAYSPSYIKNMTKSGFDASTKSTMLYWLFLISCILVFAILL